MKKILIIVLSVIPATLALLYSGGYIAQVIENYNIWQEAGGTIGSMPGPTLPSGNVLECIGTLFSYPYGFYGIGISLIAFGILAFMIMKMGYGDGTIIDRERNIEFSTKGTYGTSGFMNDKEIKNAFDVDSIQNNDGIVYGQYNNKLLFLPKDTGLNHNVAVYGAPGSMKSRAYVRNYIFQAVRRGESIVLTDPKSELYEDMSEYLREQGYNVKVFNLVSPECSDSWNCIEDIKNDGILAQTFVDVVIKNTGNGQGDDFWENASANLLKALILYVSGEKSTVPATIGDAYNLLVNNSHGELTEKFLSVKITDPAYAPYYIYKQASETVQTSIIIGLGARLQVFQNEVIKKITSKSEIDLEEPGKSKCAYFCIVSDQDSTFNFLASLFFAFLYIDLVRYADKKCVGGKLPVPVNIVLDEMTNIGAVPDLTKKISTVRSRGINTSCIFQSLPQLQNRYPDNAWQEILGNCDTQLFLGCTDMLTAEYISDRTGVATVSYESISKQLNSWRVSDYTTDYKDTRAQGRRQIMTPDEVLRLPHDEALLILRSEKILKVKKYDFSKHPHARLLKPKKASEHIPKWRLDEMKEAEKYGITPQGEKLVKKSKKKTLEEFEKELKKNESSCEVVDDTPSTVTLSPKLIESIKKDERENLDAHKELKTEVEGGGTDAFKAKFKKKTKSELKL